VSDRTHLGPQAVPDTAVDDVPLVVDLDGTLIRSNLLIESALRLLAVEPWRAWRVALWLAEGRAQLKERIAERVALDFGQVPLNDKVVQFIQGERARGRKVFLASAADGRYVRAMAERLGLFDGVFASDGQVNLRGAKKARALVDAFGEKGFDYVGNGRIDLGVWAKARRAILVDVPEAVKVEAALICADIHELDPPPGRAQSFRAHFKAMRAHQWLKNLLVFLPALAHHSLDSATLGVSALAFLAFSMCASSVYLLNDLMDLPSDRAHPTKRERPFASGRLKLVNGLALIPILLLGAGLVSLALPWQFAAVLASYYAITLLYTFVLKRRIVIDVVTLAGLYTIRVVAGGAATGIPVSEWLLAFSMFLFLCLALIKRYSELVERTRAQKSKPEGRGYVTNDTPMIGALAGASGFVSVLVLALYINSPDVHMLYEHPDMLWGVGLLLLYWVSRVLLLAHRGEVQDDPLVFAVTDRMSLVTVVLMVLIVLAGSLP